MCAAVKANWNPPVEVLDLRHFSSADLRPVLEEESRLWSEELSWDYSQSAEMILRYVDARILPGYVAMERGRIDGYAFFVYEGTKAVIGDLYARRSSAHRNAAGESSIEMRLIKHVIETLQRSPGVQRIEAQLLLHASGSVTRPFQQAGFRQHRRLFMTLPLKGSAPPGPQVKAQSQKFQLRRWTENDYQHAAAIITACYRDHIDSDINDQYRTTSGSMRFLNNIVRFPGCGLFDTQASFVAIDKETRSPAGLILCSRVKPNVGHITQICVLPQYRGHGVGEKLLAANSAELRGRGFDMLSLTVTEANAGAVHLYRRLGYNVEKVFDAFVWEG